MNPTPEQLHILLHALGLDDRHSVPWRNHYSTDEDDADLLAMVAAGWMSGPRQHGGAPLFVVTTEGQRVAMANRPAAPKTSRSKERYQRWLREDSSLRFGEWLRVERHRGEPEFT